MPKCDDLSIFGFDNSLQVLILSFYYFSVTNYPNMKRLLYSILICLVFLQFNSHAQTAESILNTYIEAAGGRSTLQEIRKIEVSSSGLFLGSAIEVFDIYEYPNKKTLSLYTDGIETSREVFDGYSGTVMQNGIQRAMTSEEISYMKCLGLFLPELYYKNYGFRVDYIGKRRIGKYNAEYYKVKFTAPSGNYFINYYDTQTGLKCRLERQDGSFDHYTDFENYDGLMMPLEYVSQQMLLKLKVTVDDIIITYSDEYGLGATPGIPPSQPASTTKFRSEGDEAELAALMKGAEKEQSKPVQQPQNIPVNSNPSTGVYQRKLALVVGNSAYQNGGALKNPVNDARSMSATLKQLGFEVMYHDNVSQSDMKRAIDAFGQKLKGYEVGLFYYAGHGIQYKGRNYMIPVEADLKAEQQIEYDCIAADRVLAYMEYAKSKVNIIVLDACRNNPFERSWNRSANGSGLAFMNAPTGSMIAYATSPGTTASDGTGSNGLYTSALLKHMNTPNITIEQMFKRVRGEVEEKSNGKQVPWESTSLKGEFYFRAGN